MWKVVFELDFINAFGQEGENVSEWRTLEFVDVQGRVVESMFILCRKEMFICMKYLMLKAVLDIKSGVKMLRRSPSSLIWPSGLAVTSRTERRKSKVKLSILNF